VETAQCHSPCEVGRCFAGRDATPVGAHVEVHDHTKLRRVIGNKSGKFFHNLDVIDTQEKLGFPGEIDHPSQFGAIGNFVCKQDAMDAILNQALGFVESCASHANCTCRKLPSGKRGTFVVLKVWTKLGGASGKEICHLCQVAFEHWQVNQERRSFQFDFGLHEHKQAI
jgi:hypothetical protein